MIELITALLFALFFISFYLVVPTAIRAALSGCVRPHREPHAFDSNCSKRGRGRWLALTTEELSRHYSAERRDPRPGSRG